MNLFILLFFYFLLTYIFYALIFIRLFIFYTESKKILNHPEYSDKGFSVMQFYLNQRAFNICKTSINNQKKGR